jgi:uncharacterized coiled-coil protein SlyX
VHRAVPHVIITSCGLTSGPVAMTERRGRRDPATRDELEPELGDDDLLADEELGRARGVLDDVEDDQTAEGRGHSEAERLMHAMKKLRTAAHNLVALQHGHQEMEHRLGDLEHAAAQRGETLARLREHIHDRETKLEELQVEVERLRQSSEPLQAPVPQTLSEHHATELVDGHLLFAPDRAGYILEERSGPPPAPGETVVLGDTRIQFVVMKVGASPLPGDRRRCSYLLRAAHQPRD